MAARGIVRWLLWKLGGEIPPLDCATTMTPVTTARTTLTPVTAARTSIRARGEVA